MQRRKAVFTYLIVAMGMVVIIIFAFLAKDTVLERWYLWKLKTGDQSERELALNRLVAAPPARIIPRIIKIAKELDLYPIDHTCFQVITKIGPNKASPILLREMARLCNSPIRIEDEKRMDEYSNAVSFIHRSFCTMGQEVVPILLNELNKGKDAEIRVVAAVVLFNMRRSNDLGSLRGEIRQNLLRSLKGDGSWLVRRWIAMMIGEFQPVGAETISALQETLKDENESVREMAARTLQKIQAMPASLTDS